LKSDKTFPSIAIDSKPEPLPHYRWSVRRIIIEARDLILSSPSHRFDLERDWPSHYETI